MEWSTGNGSTLIESIENSFPDSNTSIRLGIATLSPVALLISPFLFS